MDYENFLTHIYFGRLDPEPFDRFRDFEANETTQRIIHKFLEANSEYPSSLLEEQGIVPADLMQKLGRNDFFGLTLGNALLDGRDISPCQLPFGPNLLTFSLGLRHAFFT
ncbi:MAG: hypothetical protein JRF29_00230, partial [Deltaproteobacteria bacterium]|nr:hypothetical protein [Deltaproteobacteria bacterium]